MQRMIQSLEFQSQALVLRSERQRLLASNIANADTPGYVARDLDFRRALLTATGSGDRLALAPTGRPGSVALGSTDSSTNSSTDRTRVDESDLVYTRTSQDGLDNTQVDMERERTTWAENAVQYEATLRFINTQARALMDAMKSPNQG